MYRPPDEIIITLVARQFKVIKVILNVSDIPGVIAQRWEKAVDVRTFTILTNIRIDKIVIIYPHILIDGEG